MQAKYMYWVLALILTLTFLNDSIWNVSNEPWMVLICKNVKHFTLGNFKHFQIMKISIELLKLKILQFALGKNIKNQPHLKRWQRRIALIRNCKPSLWRTFFYIQLSMSSTRFFSEIFHNKTSKYDSSSRPDVL